MKIKEVKQCKNYSKEKQDVTKCHASEHDDEFVLVCGNTYNTANVYDIIYDKIVYASLAEKQTVVNIMAAKYDIEEFNENNFSLQTLKIKAILRKLQPYVRKLVK